MGSLLVLSVLAARLLAAAPRAARLLAGRRHEDARLFAAKLCFNEQNSNCLVFWNTRSCRVRESC